MEQVSEGIIYQIFLYFTTCHKRVSIVFHCDELLTVSCLCWLIMSPKCVHNEIRRDHNYTIM